MGNTYICKKCTIEIKIRNYEKRNNTFNALQCSTLRQKWVLMRKFTSPVHYHLTKNGRLAMQREDSRMPNLATTISLSIVILLCSKEINIMLLYLFMRIVQCRKDNFHDTSSLDVSNRVTN